jgi:hypothetical protein
MKKVLLGTTALVAAGAFAGIGAVQAQDMMEPVSVGVGGYYKAAIGFASGSAAKDVQSPSIGQDIEIIVGGSTTLDNGLTVGVQANIEGNSDQGKLDPDKKDVSGVSGGINSAALDERWIYFSGSFGDIQLGSIESASQQLTNFAPNAASNFGVNSPFFLFAPDSYIATYDDGIGAEDSAKLVYFSPSFNGFRVGASFAPGDAHQGQYGGNASGGMVDHTSIAAEYSVDFGDANIRAMIGHEKYSMDGICDGSAMSTAASMMTTPIVYVTGNYTVAQKIAIITNTFDTDGTAGLGTTLQTDDAGDDISRSSELLMAVDKAVELWGDNEGANPLVTLDGDGVAEDFVSSPNNTLPMEFRSGETTGGEDVEVAAKSAPNCGPTAMRYGLTISGGGFAVGGGILTTDMANDREKTSYDVGVSYSDGAYSVALVMANSTEDAVGGGESEVERTAINASYDLGPGISLQAQVDEGEATAANGSSADWTQIMFGTSISF